MAKGWYLLTVYSGDENKIKELIETKAKQANLYQIGRCVIPVQLSREESYGRLMDKRRKLFPGQLAIEIDGINEELVFWITSLPGVSGFASGYPKPQPLRPHEVPSLFTSSVLPKAVKAEGVGVGSHVRVKDGPLQGIHGTVTEMQGEKLWIDAEIFGAIRRIEIGLGHVEVSE